MLFETIFLGYRNVCATYDSTTFLEKFISHTGTVCTIDTLREILNELLPRYENAELCTDEFIARLLERAGVEADEIRKGVFERYFAGMYTGHNEHLRKMLQMVQSNIEIYLVCDTNEMHRRRCIDNDSFLQKIIPNTDRLYSYEMSEAALNISRYEFAVCYASVDIKRILLVESSEQNLAKWRALGGTGILYKMDNPESYGLEFILRRSGLLIAPQVTQRVHHRW